MSKKRFNMDDMMEDVSAYIEKPQESASLSNKMVQEAPVPVPDTIKQDLYKEPNKEFRRNITLSEEQFRRLEFIKKTKNKARAKGEELITLDKLMFDMVQYCLDTQYQETKVMFEKYLKLKEMADFEDLI